MHKRSIQEKPHTKSSQKKQEQIRLFIGSIPKLISKKELKSCLKKAAAGKKISNFHVKRKKGQSRGYAFFETTSLALAIKLTSEPLKLKKKELYTQLSHKSLMRHRSKLNMRGFIKNLPKDVPDRLITKCLSKHAEVKSFYSIKDWSLNSKGYGFVDFKTVEDLEKISKNGMEVDIFGISVVVEQWALKEADEEEDKKERSKKNSSVEYEVKKKNSNKEDSTSKKRMRKKTTEELSKEEDEATDKKTLRKKTTEELSVGEGESPKTPVAVNKKKISNIVPLIHEENDFTFELTEEAKEQRRKLDGWSKESTLVLVKMSCEYLDSSEANYRVNSGRRPRRNIWIRRRRIGARKNNRYYGIQKPQKNFFNMGNFSFGF